MTKTQSLFVALFNAIKAKLEAIQGFSFGVATVTDITGIEPGRPTDDATVLFLPPTVETWNNQSQACTVAYPIVILTRVDAKGPNVLTEVEVVSAIAAVLTEIEDCLDCTVSHENVIADGKERISSYRIGISWNGLP